MIDGYGPSPIQEMTEVVLGRHRVNQMAMYIMMTRNDAGWIGPERLPEWTHKFAQDQFRSAFNFFYATMRPRINLLNRADIARLAGAMNRRCAWVGFARPVFLSDRHLTFTIELPDGAFTRLCRISSPTKPRSIHGYPTHRPAARRAR